MERGSVARNQEYMLALYWRLIVRPHLVYVAAIVGLIFLTGLLEMTTVGLGVPLIEVATSNAQPTSPSSTISIIKNLLSSVGYPLEDKGKLIFVLLVMVSVMAALKSGLFMGSKYVTTIIAQNLRRESKLKLLDRVLHARYDHISRKSRGAILYDINYPSQSLYLIIHLLGNFSSNLINATLMVGLMFYLSIPATITIAMVGGCWLYFWRRLLGPRMLLAGKQIYELNQLMGKVDVDTIDGLKVVKSNNLEPKKIRIQENLLVSEMDPKKKASVYTEGMLFVNEVSAGIVIVILAGITFGLNWFHLDFARLVVLLLAVRRVSPAFSAVSRTYLELKKELRGVEAMDQILLRTPQERQGGLRGFSVQSVHFKDVGFSYLSGESGENWALKGINIDACKGDAIAIVGPTGSGKSTLVNILLGFYSPSSGLVMVNENPLDQVDINYWRGKVGYVSQDVFLFNETIFQNIVLWDEAVTKEEVIRAAQIAQIHDFIESLPEGYDTLVGDRGLKLSGGQCQRIAIARIILKKPEVIIFDEATSALDNVTEKAVYNAIQVLKGETLSIIIAHRLSSLKHVDKIYVLDSGCIVEEGTHASLMRESGVYFSLYTEGEGKDIYEYSAV